MVFAMLYIIIINNDKIFIKRLLKTNSALQTAINKIDTEFNITKKILESSEYKAYEENYGQFKLYYRFLRRKSSNDVDYNNELKNKTQYKAFKDVKEEIKDIKENKVVKLKKNIIKNNNEPAMPEIIYSNILPFLVHTNLDRKANTNN